MEKLHHNPEEVPKVISLQLLNEITNYFSEERKLGSGTFGKVYKGVQNGTEIAVKMLHLMPGCNDLEQFQKEFENLMRLKHENIVRLLSYCYEVKYEYVDPGDGRRVFAQNINRALCFEYMHNGSLQKHLNDAHHGLDWQERYRIIKGICKGLKYLHEELETPMYHLDLKPDNILLDKNMVPKLADFGLSKLVRSGQTQATQSSYGTIGYMPPEYIEQDLVSNKFDIFSLGVVMIRIVTGFEGYYKKTDMTSQEFIHLAQKSWRERLQGSISLEDECHQVKRCIEIALDCVKADRKQRPTIGSIVHWLSETENVNEKLGIGSPHKTRHHAVSHIEKERQEDVNRLLQRTRLEMHAAVQSGGRPPKPLNGASVAHLKSSSDGTQNCGPSKGKKRDRAGQGNDPAKRNRDRPIKVNESESGSLKMKNMMSEIAKITEKGGLPHAGTVEKLVHLMQLDRTERKIDLAGRVMLADIIAATESPDCLVRFVQLKGLPVLDDWLQEAGKGESGEGSSPKETDKRIEEFIFAMLRALDKLPINLNALQSCRIGRSVNHLRSHKNLEIQKAAKSLIDIWKNRVDAEMMSNDEKAAVSVQAAPCVGASTEYTNAADDEGGKKPGRRREKRANVKYAGPEWAV